MVYSNIKMLRLLFSLGADPNQYSDQIFDSNTTLWAYFLGRTYHHRAMAKHDSKAKLAWEARTEAAEIFKTFLEYKADRSVNAYPLHYRKGNRDGRAPIGLTAFVRDVFTGQDAEMLLGVLGQHSSGQHSSEPTGFFKTALKYLRY